MPCCWDTCDTTHLVGKCLILLPVFNEECDCKTAYLYLSLCFQKVNMLDYKSKNNQSLACFSLAAQISLFCIKSRAKMGSYKNSTPIALSQTKQTFLILNYLR